MLKLAREKCHKRRHIESDEYLCPATVGFCTSWEREWKRGRIGKPCRYRRQESKGKGMRVLKGLKAGEIGGNLGCLNCQQNHSNKPMSGAGSPSCRPG